MNYQGYRVVTFISILACSPLLAADLPAKKLSKPRADAVTQLKMEDSVFALLIEAYHQRQTAVIEQDYQARLKAAEMIGDIEERIKVEKLARQERELRLQRLAAQSATFSSAYDVSHQNVEQTKGISVPSNVNTNIAAEQLRDFVTITPNRR